MAVTHTDPPTVVRGPAVQDNQSVDGGANFDIQPPAGEEWFIELIVYGGNCTLKWSDGTNDITMFSRTDAPNSLEKCEYTVTHDHFIRVTNDEGSAKRFGYSGYKILS